MKRLMGNRRLWQELLAIVGFVVLLPACPSLSTLQTPSTVPEGEVRFALGLEAVGASGEDVGGSSTSFVAPQFEFAVRYGVTDNIDLGGKIFAIGGELGMKYQFLEGSFDGAVAPSLSFISFSSSTTAVDGTTADESVSILYMHLPFLFGANVSDTITVGFGPKFMYVLAFGDVEVSGEGASATMQGLMGGLYLGLPIQVGDAFWIAPEINVYTQLAVEDVDAFSDLVWQGGLGLYFGGGGDSDDEDVDEDATAWH